MTRQAVVPIAAALVASALVPGFLEAQQLDASQRALLEAQARSHIETYYDHYYERDMDPLPTEIFHIPWILLDAEGPQATESRGEASTNFQEGLESLLDQGWDRSTFRPEDVCILNPGAAIVSGTNTRTRADGSVMSVGGVSYILARSDDGWRIVSYASHSPDRIVRCDSRE